MPAKFSTERRAAIIAALKHNPNANAVSQGMDCSVAIAAKIAKDAGIALTAGKSRAGWLPPETHALVFAELQSHPNATAVAKKFGCSRSTVIRVARTAGIDLTVNSKPRARISDPNMQPTRTRKYTPT